MDDLNLKTNQRLKLFYVVDQHADKLCIDKSLTEKECVNIINILHGYLERLQINTKWPHDGTGYIEE